MVTFIRKENKNHVFMQHYSFHDGLKVRDTETLAGEYDKDGMFHIFNSPEMGHEEQNLLKSWLALQPQSTPPAIEGHKPVTFNIQKDGNKHKLLMAPFGSIVGQYVATFDSDGKFVIDGKCLSNEEKYQINKWILSQPPFSRKDLAPMPEVVLPQSESEVIASLDAEPAPTGLNPDQQAIWNIYEAAKIKALKKNLAYGSSVFKKGVLTPELSADAAIRVRMSDKVGRLTTLLADPDKNQISDESIDDTIMDLATYAFLLLIARKRDLK